jgi:chemotaxis signal transduction protein
VLQDGGLNCVTGLGKYQGRLIVLLDMAKLLENSAARKTESEAGKPDAGKMEARSAAAATK